jgi:hypothetical protein
MKLKNGVNFQLASTPNFVLFFLWDLELYVLKADHRKAIEVMKVIVEHGFVFVRYL